MNLSPETLRAYGQAQERARQWLTQAARTAREGESERELASRLSQEARSAGAQGWFHTPLAWFGARTGTAFEQRRDAFPGEGTLGAEDVGILDAAPIFDGFAVDVSLSFALGEPAWLSAAETLLHELRGELPSLVEGEGDGRAIARAVYRRIEAAGFESLQERYLFGALGHRVFPVRSALFAGRTFAGLGLSSMASLFGRALLSRVPGLPARWPFWADDPRAAVRPATGLWSFEPHFGRDGLGVKWEELLVLDASGARWLQQEPPAEGLILRAGALAQPS